MTDTFPTISGFMMDLEGVLVGDKRYVPVEGAVEFVSTAKEAGHPVRVITNNTTHDRTALAKKLGSAGFDLNPDEIHTCTGAALSHLVKVEAQSCMVLGNQSLRRIFEEAGFTVTPGPDADALVVGLDRDITSRKLTLACRAVLEFKADFIALHRNRLYRDESGCIGPSAGAIVAAIEYATQVRASVMGKPSPSFFQHVLGDMALPPSKVLMVSDDPFGDLPGARALGMKTAFVLSGNYRSASVLDETPEEEKPDVIAEKAGDLTKGVLRRILT